MKYLKMVAEVHSYVNQSQTLHVLKCHENEIKNCNSLFLGKQLLGVSKVCTHLICTLTQRV